MAAFPELMKAIETNGLAVASVLDAVNAESAEIKAALEAAATGSATSEQLQAAIASIEGNTEKLGQAKDAVSQLIPTVQSPEMPSEPGEGEMPTTAEPPSTPDQIVISPNPDVGLPDSVEIDIR